MLPLYGFSKIVPFKAQDSGICSYQFITGDFLRIILSLLYSSNKSRLHQYGFLLLDRVQSNIVERDNDLKRLYHNTSQKDKSGDGVSLKELEIKLLSVNPQPRMIESSHGILCSAAKDSASKDEFAYFGDLNGWQRMYGVNGPTDSIILLGIPANEFLQPCFSYKKELFESYMLLGSCQQEAVILYQDAVGISGNRHVDTLLSSDKNKPFPQIVDVNIEGTAYKMFISNFQLAGQDLTLCGLVKSGIYDGKLNTIPVNLIYPVVVIFLLLIIFLPFIKIFLMSPHEQMHMADFIFAILALFVGASIITLISIQLLLLTSSNQRVQANLENYQNK